MTSFFLLFAVSILILLFQRYQSQQGLSIRHEIKARLRHLSKIIKFVPKISDCNSTAYIIITEIPYGNSGNNIIEFTHGLWLSKIYNYTFVVPPWIQPALYPFNLTSIYDRFCFTFNNTIPKNSVTLEVTSEDSFWLYKLFRDPMYQSHIPTFHPSVIEDISTHFVFIYSALWSNPSHHIINATAWLIDSKLGSSFNYTTIHKRSLEGGCNKLLQRSPKSDYDPNQIDLNHPSWNGNLRNYHPICEMPLDFALETMRINNITTKSLFLAYDGRGSIDEYKAINTTLSTDLDLPIVDKTMNNNIRKFVDMFTAINGNFFIMNPYSTFSFQIFVIRVCLDLQSVPKMERRDIYFKTKDDSPVKEMWVSADSIIKAYQRIKLMLL